MRSNSVDGLDGLDECFRTFHARGQAGKFEISKPHDHVFSCRVRKYSSNSSNLSTSFLTDRHREKMKFKIRSYDKRELAMLYFPGSDRDTALRHLRRWIIRCPELCRELADSHAAAKAKTYTPHQVKLITDHLGEP